MTLEKGDRVEYGGKGQYGWHGTVVERRGAYLDIQWDHNPPGDVDVAVRIRDGVRPEETSLTRLNQSELAELRRVGIARAGRFVDPVVIRKATIVLDKRGEPWAATILGHDISKRSAAVPNRPALGSGDEYVLVLADKAETNAALASLRLFP